MKINIKRAGFALGTTGVVMYLGCIVIMAVLGREGTIKFFNSLLHGLDVSSIVRQEIPIWEALLGIIQTFVIGWVIGAFFGLCYNFRLTQ